MGKAPRGRKGGRSKGGRYFAPKARGEGLTKRQYTGRPPPQHYPPPGSTAKRKGRARQQGDRNGHTLSNDYRSRDGGFVLAPKSHQKGGNLFDVMPVGVTRLKKSEKKVGVAILKTLTPGMSLARPRPLPPFLPPFSPPSSPPPSLHDELLAFQRYASLTPMEQRARIKVVEALNNLIKVEVDIRVSPPDHAAVALLQRLCTFHPCFAPVAILLKVLLHQGRMDKPFEGGLGSYKLYLLLARFLKHHYTGSRDDAGAVLLVRREGQREGGREGQREGQREGRREPAQKKKRPTGPRAIFPPKKKGGKEEEQGGEKVTLAPSAVGSTQKRRRKDREGSFRGVDGDFQDTRKRARERGQDRPKQRRENAMGGERGVIIEFCQ
ncbi:hypothetical protein NSK_007131 [Nannochloropsis salina CCMP1776]|uniref:Uncharacterized protein n=1 Tax=Nannochloropsis salina CCMP1776 TaxID=1027361 RepID=A0A4D9CTI9_9STRA|nr:hypothetical protein NSK_007131 [Nannochloropsis salina CCMP1776]|eukprot:TFJ81884.1 hypothetical protein NSK_007131 [Nannochloropsis salina CCMP1776]